MKKILSMILAFCLIFSVIAMPLSVVSAEESTVTYYVSSNGSDETGDGSESNPYATIAKAEEEIDKVEAENRVISLLDDMVFSAAEHTNMITLVGPGRLDFTNFDNIKGPTTFDLTIYGSNSNVDFATEGHEVVMGANSSFDGCMPQFLLGNKSTVPTQKQKITFNKCGQGQWTSATFFIGNYGASSYDVPGFEAVFNNSHFWKFNFSTGTPAPNYTEDFNITFNNSKFWNSWSDVSNSISKFTFGGALQIVFNNSGDGSVIPATLLEKQATDGEWFMFATDYSGHTLSTTETAGTFKVNGTLQAKAVERTSGAEYYSDKNGNLTVPEGKYDVTFAEPIEEDVEEVEEIKLYVSSTGSDETGDGSEANPFATIARAEAKIDNIKAKNRIISLLDNVSFTAAAHKNMVTIVGPGTLTFTETALLGPTTFDLKTSGSMRTGGYEVVLGTNFAFDGMPLQYFGGLNSHSGQREKVTINGCGSGMWVSALLRIIASSQNPRLSPGMDMVINGGHFWQFCISGESTNPSTYTGDFNVTINGGSHYNTFLFDGNNQEVATFQGALQFVFNNGAAPSILGSDILTKQASKGEWFMFAAKDDNNKLEITETAGTFKVIGSKFAKAVNNSTGNSYYSDYDGNLIVPEGQYTVTYVNSPGVVAEITRYVSETGSDDNDGKTAETAFATIAKAETVLSGYDALCKKIKIVGTVDYDGGVAHTAMVTYEGVDENAALKMKLPANVNMNYGWQYFVVEPKGPVTFQNILIKRQTEHVYQLMTGNQEVIMGEGVYFEGTSDSYYLVGHRFNNEAHPQKIVLNTGTNDAWSGSQVHIGVFNDDHPVAEKWLGKVDLTINGGTFRLVRINAGTLKEGINLTFNGGQFTTGDGGFNKAILENHATINGPVQVLFNNGYTAYSNFDLIDAETTGEKWFMYSDTTGGSLSTTDISGSFLVNGTMYAIASPVGDDSVKYYGAPGEKLRVPAGEYNVTYVEEIPENIVEIKLDGEVYALVEAGTEFTLPTLTKHEFEFLGWTDGTVTYAGGEVITVNSDIALTAEWKTQLAVAYVSADGDDNNDGSKEAPYATIAKAVAELDKINATYRKVYVVGTVALTSTAHTNNIIITSEDGSAIIKGSGELKGPTTFEKIKFNSDVVIYNDSNDVTFASEVAIAGMPWIYLGPKTEGNTNREKVVINQIGSGQWDVPMFRIGAYNTSKTSNGIDLVINGGRMHQVLFTDGKNIFNGDVNITLNGGTINTALGFAGNVNNSTFNGALQVIDNTGNGEVMINGLVKDINAKGGSWFIYDDVNENGGVRTDLKQYKGCKLNTTDVAGTFAIENGSALEKVYAILTNVNDPTKVYYSDESGKITVPAGEWVVTYATEKPAFHCTGSEVVFNEAVENFDLSEITSVVYEDKVIVGWKTADGEYAANNASYTAGTVLYAEYADFTKNDFSITGTEMRLGSNHGIRFLISKSNSLYENINGYEYGMIAINADNVPYTVTGDIEIGGDYNGYEPAVIESLKDYRVYDDSVVYTLCLTEIDEEYYATDYMVRGYIKFIDNNGTERVVYTDFEVASVKSTVEKMLRDENVSEETKTYLEDEYMTVIEALKEEAAYAYEAQASAAEKDAFGAYNLSSGLNIREIELNGVASENTEEVDIVHVTDLHFNLLNAKDFRNNRQTTLSFYRNRDWLKDGTTAALAARTLAYADAVGDKTVVTGDTLDSLSYGALDLTKRLILDKYPTMYVTSGNHEWVEQGGVGRINETLSYEERLAMLCEYYGEDFLYSSDIVKDKVMVIQMDNAFWNNDVASYSFVESQYEKLQADLEKARANGYTVLLFQHTAFKIDGEQNVTSSDPRAVRMYSSSVNFAQGDNYIQIPEGSTNKKIYDLVTSSSDVIKGIFTGHIHSSVDTTVNGIPQYVLASNQYDGGCALKITVK